MRLLSALVTPLLSLPLLAPPAVAQCGGPDGFEENDTCETAAYTQTGAAGLSVYLHDADWFRVPVPPHGRVVIDVLFSHVISNVDVRLWGACAGTMLAWSYSTDDDEQVIGINYGNEPVDFFAEVYLNPATSGDCNDYDIVVQGASENIGANYCHSNPNSTGEAALMYAGGSLSVALDHVTLFAAPVPPRQPGIFFYGPQKLEIPFGSGWRCVGPGPIGTFFLPARMSSAAGELRSDLDLSDPPASGGEILRGSTWNFQAWFRDPAASGFSFNLSDGLTLVFQP